MKTISTRFLPLVVALFLSFGIAAAQTSGGIGTRNAETRNDDKLAGADRKFIQKAAENGMFEVEIAQLASSKATNPDVKALATALVNDHTKANNELVQLATSRKMELPAAPPRGKRQDIEKLAKLTGDDFDQRFVREVAIKDHEKDIRQFEKASERAKDPELKAWINKTLYKMREHLAQAQKLPQRGPDASAMGNKGAAAPLTAGPAGGKSGANKTGS